MALQSGPRGPLGPIGGPRLKFRREGRGTFEVISSSCLHRLRSNFEDILSYSIYVSDQGLSV